MVYILHLSCFPLIINESLAVRTHFPSRGDHHLSLCDAQVSLTPYYLISFYCRAPSLLSTLSPSIIYYIYITDDKGILGSIIIIIPFKPIFMGRNICIRMCHPSFFSSFFFFFQCDTIELNFLERIVKEHLHVWDAGFRKINASLISIRVQDFYRVTDRFVNNHLSSSGNSFFFLSFSSLEPSEKKIVGCVNQLQFVLLYYSPTDSQQSN